MNNIKDYWSELNPKELNDIINLFIKQKIYSPQKMRELYNQAINNSSSSRPQNISKYNKFDIGGLVDLDTTSSSKVLYSEDSENNNSNNNFIIKQALKIANEMLESNRISDNQKNRLLEFAMRISGGNADSSAINKASKYILSKYGRKALFQVLNTNDPVSNIIDKSIEESNYEVGDNYTGLAFLGDVWDKDSFLWNNKNSSDFIDTYIRGDIPFESAGVIKIDDKDENRLGRYSKYIEKNYPDRDINTYQAYRDTLDNDLVKYLDKASTALETDTFGANADNYDIDKSMFPFGTEDNRGFFDAAGYNIELMEGPDGKIYGRRSDIYDFLPSDFNNKWADNNKMHNIVEKINNFGNPFIFRTPWFKASDENIPEEVLSKYADKNKKSLGGRINLSNNNIFEEGGFLDILKSILGFGKRNQEDGGNYIDYFDASDELKSKIKLPNKIQKYNMESVSQYGDTHYDVFEARYKGLKKAMKDASIPDEDIERLLPFVITQNILEGGYRVNRDDNNFGGLMVSKGNENVGRMKFKTPEDYYKKYISNLDEKWGDEYLGENKGWRHAKSIEDYARILNREDLELTTEERFNSYNLEHPKNPAYLYTPEWKNNYKPLMHTDRFGGIYPRVNAYMKLLNNRIKAFNDYAKENNLIKN